MEVTASDLRLLIQAAGVSLLLAILSIASATLLSLPLTALAFARLAPLRHLYGIYIFVVRGTPVLVQALMVFYALATFWVQVSPYTAGAVVLTIYLSALFAEVLRGGVLAIPRSLWDSAKSLGLPRSAIFRQLVAPMVARYSLPPYLNVCVIAVKASSVLSIISVWELTFAAREIIERTLAVFQVLSIAAVLYFVMCFAMDRAGRLLERRLMAKGFAGERL